MRKLRPFLLFFIMMAAFAVEGQTERPQIYDPSLDARDEIAKMVKEATAEGKHILLQVGGNW